MLILLYSFTNVYKWDVCVCVYMYVCMSVYDISQKLKKILIKTYLKNCFEKQ